MPLLIWCLYRQNQELKGYQRHIDSIFQSNFALLCDSLNENPDEDDWVNLCEQTYLTTNLLELTKWDTNDSLREILEILREGIVQRKQFSSMVRKDLSYYSRHIDDVEFAMNVARLLREEWNNLTSWD